eukprot:3694827-Pyramimonas_sp.AAC.1
MSKAFSAGVFSRSLSQAHLNGPVPGGLVGVRPPRAAGGGGEARRGALPVQGRAPHRLVGHQVLEAPPLAGALR